MVLNDCDVYSYKADVESDPFGECCCLLHLISRFVDSQQLQKDMLATGEDGNVWAFNFFFYNKKLKRIAYFSCRGISKSVAGTVGPEDSGLTYGSDSDNEEAVTRYGMAHEMDL